MRSEIAVIVCLVAVLGSSRGQATEPPGRALGAEVRGVFVAKCAVCHGPDLLKPQGRFGYVLDLRRVAGNPEMVVPGRPDESELWALVQHGDMPPTDSSHGPLTPSEKETIRAWIAAGAPDAADKSTLPSAESSGQPSVSPTARTVRWLGKFHLLLLHFPIALMFAAGIGELVASRQGSRVPSPAVQFCLMLAAVAVIPTVAFGWLHAAAGNGVGSHELLTVHRWLGTFAGGWVIGTSLIAVRDSRRDVRSRDTQVALAVGILVVAATAHAGGLMVHGRDFLD